jgi:hypothetical protein
MSGGGGCAEAACEAGAPCAISGLCGASGDVSADAVSAIVFSPKPQFQIVPNPYFDSMRRNPTPSDFFRGCTRCGEPRLTAANPIDLWGAGARDPVAAWQPLQTLRTASENVRY